MKANTGSFINFEVLFRLYKPMGGLTMRKVLITMGYIPLVFKLTAIPAQANSNGYYREFVETQQYDEEDDLSFFDSILIIACVVGVSYWLRFK